MAEQTSFFTKENTAIVISMLSFIVAILSYLLNKRKVKLDIINLKTEMYLGAEKLIELLMIIKGMKNIDPSTLTVQKFEEDKILFTTMFSKYDENEEKIIKASYVIPSNMTTIRRLLKSIENNFNDQIEKEHRTLDQEKLINYRQLFFQFYLLANTVNAVDSADGLHKNDEDYSKYFMVLYLNFQQYQYNLQSQKWNALMAEGEEMMKNI